jgi:flagellar assembly factor FliW
MVVPSPTLTAVTNGDLDASELREICLDDGLVGMPDARRFALVRWGDDPATLYSVLRCLDDPELELVVVPPAVFFPDYAPEIDDALAAQLALTDDANALLRAVITVGERPELCTANLLGPIVVNLDTLRGAQAVLSPERYSARQPLVARP